MKLVGAWIQGFRCYENRTDFTFDDLTVLIGRNDAGKSSVLDALDIFFDEKEAPDGDDVCVHCASKEVRIACLFADLPTKLVLDATHPTDLQAEHLLNGDGRLEIIKTYSCGAAGKGKLKTVNASAYHPTAEGYGDLLTLKISELKARAQQLGVPLGAVNQTISSELRRATWAHATNLAPAIVDIVSLLTQVVQKPHQPPGGKHSRRASGRATHRRTPPRRASRPPTASPASLLRPSQLGAT